MKTTIDNNQQINEILGKTYFDKEHKDYFTVNEIDESGNWAYITYIRTQIWKRRSVSFIVYHIDAGEYLPKPV